MTDIDLALARLGQAPMPAGLAANDDAVLTGAARRQQEAALAPRLMGVAEKLSRLAWGLSFPTSHAPSGLFFRSQDSHHMRLLLLGALAPAVLMTAPANARPTRVDIPVQIQPNSWVYVQWVTVKAEDGRTIVSGYVRNKKWFANRRGDLHIAFVKNDQQIGCQESNWRKYRFHSRGQWRFSASADIPASDIDSIRISHAIHDQGSDHPANSLNTCSG